MKTIDRGLTDIGTDTVKKWKRLADIATVPNPFVDPRFLLPSARSHPQARDGRVMLVEDGSDLISALSYTPSARKVGPLRLRSLSTSESFSAFEGERYHPLIAPGKAEEVFAALIDGARSQRAHVLELARLPLDDGFGEALLNVARARGLPVLVEYEREFACIGSESLNAAAGDGSPFALGHLSGNSRKKLRRLVRILEQDHGPLEVVDESRDPEAIGRFLDLQNSGWKGDAAQDGKAFERTGLDEWFRAVTDAFRDDARLSALSLRTSNRTVFSTVVLHAGSTAFGFHDAYGDEFTQFSPGRLGRLAEIQAVLTSGDVELFDPSMDDEKYPQALGLYPERRRYASYTVGVYGAGRRVIRHLPTARRVRDRLRRERV